MLRDFSLCGSAAPPLVDGVIAVLPSSMPPKIWNDCAVKAVFPAAPETAEAMAISTVPTRPTKRNTDTLRRITTCRRVIRPS